MGPTNENMGIRIWGKRAVKERGVDRNGISGILTCADGSLAQHTIA